VSQPSLRRTLLSWLIPPLLLVMVLGSYASFEYSYRAATRAFDQSLIDTAMALGGHIRMHGSAATIEISAATDQIVRSDQFDKIYYVVRDGNGNTLAGDGELAALLVDTGGKDDQPTFDATFLGKPVRAAVVRIRCGDADCLIAVAETTVKRINERNRTLAVIVFPEIILMVVALAFVWVGVGRGIQPLARLSEEIRLRSPTELVPFESDKVLQDARAIVTELNSLFERVNESSANQKRFTANAAHQLRTPLAVLQTHLELALMQPSSPALKEHIEHAHAATVRSSRLTNQLLTLARVEPSGKAAIAAETVDLQTVAEGLANEFVHRALGRGVDLGFELASAPITGDGFMLHEALTNSVLNAIEYGRENGRITVRTGIASERAFLEVEDDGPGIPVVERERVLERFYRMPGTTGVGSGLGLSIVREIVQQHRGTLAILDGEAGRGCRVRMEFPVAASNL
jgi:two-component system, OmpR family, sensor histidine kinase TctE